MIVMVLSLLILTDSTFVIKKKKRVVLSGPTKSYTILQKKTENPPKAH